MNASTGAARPVPQASPATGASPGTEARAAVDVAPAPDAAPVPDSPLTQGSWPAPAGLVLPGQAHGPGLAGAYGPDDPAESGSSAAPADEDAAHTADAAATGRLLRCWVRERDIRRTAAGDDDLVLTMRASGVTLRVPVRHWSPTGLHDFGRPFLEGAPGEAAPLDAVTLAALIAREASLVAYADADVETPGGPDSASPAARSGGGAEPAAASGRAAPASGAADLVARVADSVRRTADFIAVRRSAPKPPPAHGPFIDAEQSLVLGHPLHPAPKSRQGLSDEECEAFSPEVRATFPLHWIAVDESVLACDSAWTERGRTVVAGRLAARLAGEKVASRLPAGTVPLPLHPWQARRVRHRPSVARLFAEGLLHDLGEAGGVWHPTSSVRTVARPGGPAMLKLSLGLPITNSRRENLRKELLRGLEVHRLLRSGLGAQWRAAHPGFDIVRDPAWLGVDGPDGQPVAGLDTVIRHNPFAPEDDVVCVAGLTAERPSPASPYGPMRSRLAELVEGLAARTGRAVGTVATEWFLRYLDAVVRPVLWLDAHAGVALEAHQQNTLVMLDEDGWPAGGRYRDNQGYYFRESRRDALQQRLPGARLGVDSDTFVDDTVADERLAYYLGINNLLGLIGALGVQRLADERVLLAAARQFLRMRARGGDDGPVSALPALLLESPTLRCKANLLTRVHGMDELVGPVDTQSVYVTVANPLCR